MPAPSRSRAKSRSQSTGAKKLFPNLERGTLTDILPITKASAPLPKPSFSNTFEGEIPSDVGVIGTTSGNNSTNQSCAVLDTTLLDGPGFTSESDADRLVTDSGDTNVDDTSTSGFEVSQPMANQADVGVDDFRSDIRTRPGFVTSTARPVDRLSQSTRPKRMLPVNLPRPARTRTSLSSKSIGRSQPPVASRSRSVSSKRTHTVLTSNDDCKPQPKKRGLPTRRRSSAGFNHVPYTKSRPAPGSVKDPSGSSLLTVSSV